MNQFIEINNTEENFEDEAIKTLLTQNNLNVSNSTSTVQSTKRQPQTLLLVYYFIKHYINFFQSKNNKPIYVLIKRNNNKGNTMQYVSAMLYYAYQLCDKPGNYLHGSD